jgi:hypothetical protein
MDGVFFNQRETVLQRMMGLSYQGLAGLKIATGMINEDKPLTGGDHLLLSHPRDFAL